MNKITKPLCTLLFAAFYSLAASSLAATQSGHMDISANVLATCTVQGSALPFGNYQSQQVEQTGNVAVNCSNGTTYTISLDAGDAGTGGTRAMQGPANAKLSYALYKDSARAQPWGNGGAADTVAGTGSGAQQNMTVYGRVPAGQNPAAGTYGDVVGVTLAY